MEQSALSEAAQAQQLSPLVSRATREALERLYPEAKELFAKADSGSAS